MAEVPRSIVRSSLPDRAKLVAVELWRCVPAQVARDALEGVGEAWACPSINTLAEALAGSIDKVKRALRDLTAAGLIERATRDLNGRSIRGWVLTEVQERHPGGAGAPPRSGPRAEVDGAAVPPSRGSSTTSPRCSSESRGGRSATSTGRMRHLDGARAPRVTGVSSATPKGQQRHSEVVALPQPRLAKVAGAPPREGQYCHPEGGSTAPQNQEENQQGNQQQQLQVGRARLGDVARELATRVLDAQNERSFPKTWRKATLVVEARLLEGLQHADRDPARAVERVTAIVAGIIRAAQARDADAVKRWGDRMFEPSWLSATEAIASRYREGADGERVAPDGSLVRVYEQPPPPKAPPELPPAEGAF